MPPIYTVIFHLDESCRIEIDVHARDEEDAILFARMHLARVTSVEPINEEVK